MSIHLLFLQSHVFAINSKISRNASVFPRPDEFLPERWQRDRPLGAIHPFAIIPFGAGARMCVGRRAAEQEMYLLLTRVRRMRGCRELLLSVRGGKCSIS